jgi:hypothetical protein
MVISKTDYSTRLLSLLPIITIMVLIYGAAKQFAYYYNFNLDIFAFLDITELLPQTIYDLFFSIFYIIIGFLVVLFYSNATHKIDNKRKISKKALSKSSLSKLSNEDLDDKIKSIKKSLLKALIYLIIFVTIWVVGHIIMLLNLYKELISFDKKQESYPSIFFFFNNFSFNLFLISIIGFIISIPFTIITSLKDRTLQVIIYLTIFLALSGFFEGQIKYFKVIKTHSHNNYSIVINNKRRYSNNDFYYIGKTKTNVFYYDVKTKLVTIYPNSLINELTIGSE